MSTHGLFCHSSNKCNFWGKKKNEVDKKKVDVIANLPSPKMIKEVRSFLGYAGFIEYYNGF